MNPHFPKLSFLHWQIARCVAACSFLVLTNVVVQGQQNIIEGPYRFLNIGEDKNLQGIKPTCIYQDSYGFVWIGTWDGLYRFDGYACKLYEHKPGDTTSLPSNFIAYHAFHEDKDSNLWIATFNSGFVMLDRKTERFHVFRETPDGLSFDGINALCDDGKDGIWVGTRDKGIKHYFPERDSVFSYQLSKTRADTLVGSDRIFDLCLAENGQLWIGTEEGAAMLDTNGHFHRFFHDQNRKGSLSASYVLDIFEDNENKIWLCTKNGLNLAVSLDSFIHYFPENSPQVPKGKGYNYIQRVFQDNEGDYWLGTLAGLLRFYPEKENYEPVRHSDFHSRSIAKGGVHGIQKDDRRRLWFSTDGGLSLLNKNTARLQDVKWASAQPIMPALNTLNGGAYLVQTGDRIWVATENGLFHFLPGQEPQSLKTGDFTALFADSKGLLYAGTGQKQFFIIDPNRLRILEQRTGITDETHSNDKAVGLRNTAFAEDRNGNIWMGTFGTLNRYNPGLKQFRQFYHSKNNNSSLSNSIINDLLTDSEGNLWIATMGGVNFLPKNELSHPFEDTSLHFAHFRHDFRNPNSISNDHVRVIFEDSRGWLWFGTDVGLNVLCKNGKWRRFFKEDGLPDNHITGIVEDRVGNIWLTTPGHGVARYEVNTNLFTRLTRGDGMNTEQFPTAACLQLRDGRLVFAGVGGLNVFDPGKLDWPLDTVPLYFVELELFNQTVEPGDRTGLLSLPIYMTREIELDFDQNVLSLQFAALNYSNPEKQVYRYRLEGFAALEQWQLLGNQREITLTNLFPGAYTLIVESTTRPDGREHWESQAKLIIRVNYPWGKMLLYAAIAFGMIYIVYKLRVRRKLAAAEARRLRELDAVKTQMYTNITHEFRTPLTVILGETSQLEKQAGENQKSSFAAIRRQGRQLLNLVNQMLDLAKVEAGSLKLHLVQGNVIPFLKYLLESIRTLADSKRIQLRFEADTDEFWMDYDPDKLQKIVFNLLSNAIKFTPEEGQVTLKLVTGSLLEFRVSDTGRGIPPEKLPYIFDRYYQADDSVTRYSEGTGIGLTLAKELVQLSGGKIRVESRLNEGTTFTVTLPVTRDAERQQLQPESTIIENQDIVPELRAGTPDAQFQITDFNRSRPRLLLVEDNTDVVQYLSSLLSADYHIHKARNGKEGVEAAFHIVPDLVISDIMMPEMDGLDLCRILKTDIRTSHIPVIMLTAKADLDSRLEGLEFGADAYLAKPFEERELKVQLRKLYELRQALRKRYAEPGLPAPSNLPAFRREDIFFQKLHAALEENYSNAAFGVPEFCSVMTMSRPNLYRKLTALTGKNIEDYLRSFRLRKAHELLRNTDLNVQEVAWDCGFNDAAHFTRVFHAEFGINPSRVR